MPAPRDHKPTSYFTEGDAPPVVWAAKVTAVNEGERPFGDDTWAVYDHVLNEVAEYVRGKVSAQLRAVSYLRDRQQEEDSPRFMREHHARVIEGRRLGALRDEREAARPTRDKHSR